MNDNIIPGSTSRGRTSRTSQRAGFVQPLTSTRKRKRVETAPVTSDSEPEFQDAVEYPESTLQSFRDLLNARISSAAASGINNSIETEEELLLFVRQIPSLNQTLAQEISKTTTTKMSMPIPGTKDAPRFDGSKPLEIPRFLDILDELFTLHSVTDAKEKRRWMLKYIPRELEEQWTEFPKFDTATWDETKEIVKSQYPEIGVSGTALLARLDAIVRANSGLNLEDPQRCYEAIRQFRPGVRDLTKSSSLMSGWEVVQVFFRMFTPAAASEVQQTLRVKKLVKNSSGATTTGVSNDYFTLDEVIETVQELVKERRANSLNTGVQGNEISERAAVVGKRAMVTEPSVVKREDWEEVSQTLATFRDSLESQAKHQKEFNQTMLEQLKELKLGGGAQPTQSYGSGGQSGFNRGGMGPRNFTCFYCNSADHGVNNCPVKEADLNAGLIHLNNRNRVCTKDGTDIRSLPGNYDKQRLENYLANQKSMMQSIPTGSVQYSGFVQQSEQRPDVSAPPSGKGVIEMSAMEKMMKRLIGESLQDMKKNFQ